MSMETQQMELRSKLKALDFKRSQVACKIYESLGGSGYFFIDDLPLDDPRISPVDKDKLMELNSRIYLATWELNKLEEDSARHFARQKVFDMISLMSIDEAITFLRRHGCLTTLELVEKVVEYPNLLDGVKV